MKIFGINFTTKKELKKKNWELEMQIIHLQSAVNAYKSLYEETQAENRLIDAEFPFAIGQTVYDVQLRNHNGRYAKKNASLEHSLINEVVVNKKNYFNIVARYKNNDVFSDYDSARRFIESVCAKK